MRHFRFQPNSGRHWDKSFPKNSCTLSKKSFCTFREQILLTAHNTSGKGKYLNRPRFFQKPCSKIISRFKTVTHRIQLTKRYFHVSCICRYFCRFLVYIKTQDWRNTLRMTQNDLKNCQVPTFLCIFVKFLSIFAAYTMLNTQRRLWLVSSSRV